MHPETWPRDLGWRCPDCGLDTRRFSAFARALHEQGHRWRTHRIEPAEAVADRRKCEGIRRAIRLGVRGPRVHLRVYSQTFDTFSSVAGAAIPARSECGGHPPQLRWDVPGSLMTTERGPCWACGRYCGPDTRGGRFRWFKCPSPGHSWSAFVVGGKTTTGEVAISLGGGLRTSVEEETVIDCDTGCNTTAAAIARDFVLSKRGKALVRIRPLCSDCMTVGESERSRRRRERELDQMRSRFSVVGTSVRDVAREFPGRNGHQKPDTVERKLADERDLKRKLRRVITVEGLDRGYSVKEVARWTGQSESTVRNIRDQPPTREQFEIPFHLEGLESVHVLDLELVIAQSPLLGSLLERLDIDTYEERIRWLWIFAWATNGAIFGFAQPNNRGAFSFGTP